jgi:hypothetical protein
MNIIRLLIMRNRASGQPIHRVRLQDLILMNWSIFLGSEEISSTFSFKKD